MTIRLHRGDLPDLARYQSGAVAIDTETMGLDPNRDRLCVVQLSPGDGSADVVQIPAGHAVRRRISSKLLADAAVLKIFHFARFDLGVLRKRLGVMPAPVYCTKIASRLARTYTDRHGLKDLVREVLGHRSVEAAATLRLGRRRRSPMRRSPMRPPTCCICMPCGSSSTPCWRARGAPTWRRLVSASCPTGYGSISPAGPPRTSSPIPRA